MVGGVLSPVADAGVVAIGFAEFIKGAGGGLVCMAEPGTFRFGEGLRGGDFGGTSGGLSSSRRLFSGLLPA